MNGLSTQGSGPAFLDHLGVLGDATRSRVLVLLERRELTVAELCAVLQAPQSTVSRHLKALADGGWVASRADGTSRLYSMTRDGVDSHARRLWQLVREQIAPAAVAVQDARRLDGVLARRRTRSQQFFTSSAGRWDQLRTELFGSSFHLHALLALLEPEWTVADLGCGTGQVAEALARWVRRVVAVDESAAMLQAARRRLRSARNVELRRGRLETLPLADGEADAATCMLVLHHLPDPEAALGEAARVLRPGGRLLVVDMTPHDREVYRQQMGHVWLGFAEEQVQALLARAGFETGTVRAVPPDADMQGPTLFAAVARRAAARAATNGRPSARR